MKTSKLTPRIVVGALVLSLSLGFASLTDFGYRVECQVYDQWFGLRYRLFGAQKIDPSLVMVGVDEPTIQSIGKPQILWQSELAELIEKIKAGEPKVVGLDFVLAPPLDGLGPDDPLRTQLTNEGFQLGMTALEGPPVVFAEAYQSDAQSETETEGNPVLSPHEAILGLLYDENGDSDRLGFVNAPIDTDGVLRRGKLLRRFHKGSGELQSANLAFRMLSLASGTPMQAEGKGKNLKLSWQSTSVPIIFQDSFMLNFPGPTEDNTTEPHDPSQAQTFPIVSALKVLSGEVPESYFKDKIVMVSPTAVSLKDAKVVPGDKKYHGAAVQMTMLNMMLQGEFISRSGLFWVLFCLFFSGVGLVLARQGKFLLAALAGLALPVISFSSLALGGFWLPTIFAEVSLATGAMLGYLERLLTVEKDRRIVRSTFGRMVSPQVMNHVLANYKSLASGTRKEITVLFTDINDFTPICEQHTPEEVIEMLSVYFGKMVEVIMKYNGYLKQYVGDEIMVIYGAPDDSDDHATRALLTALEMREVLAEMKETSGGKPGFYEVKIGLNTGSAVMGRVGPETRWEYAAVGDNVNLGARVMSVAKKLGMDIGVSAATKARYDLEHSQDFPSKIKWTSQGVQTFKGKISQMEVFGIERES